MTTRRVIGRDRMDPDRTDRPMTTRHVVGGCLMGRTVMDRDGMDPCLMNRHLRARRPAPAHRPG